MWFKESSNGAYLFGSKVLLIKRMRLAIVCNLLILLLIDHHTFKEMTFQHKSALCVTRQFKVFIS